jgi:hypothetical protein
VGADCPWIWEEWSGCPLHLLVCRTRAFGSRGAPSAFHSAPNARSGSGAAGRARRVGFPANNGNAVREAAFRIQSGAPASPAHRRAGAGQAVTPCPPDSRARAWGHRQRRACSSLPALASRRPSAVRRAAHAVAALQRCGGRALYEWPTIHSAKWFAGSPSTTVHSGVSPVICLPSGATSIIAKNRLIPILDFLVIYCGRRNRPPYTAFARM